MKDKPRTAESAGSEVEGVVATRVGKFISFEDGILTLAMAAKEGDEEPKATVFRRVTAIAIDPRDPAGTKTLPAAEVFKGMKVGTPVNVMTNRRGETTFSIASERAPNPAAPRR